MQNFFKLQSVTRHISRIILPCGVCVYLVQGTHEAVLLDTGFGIGDLRGFVEQNVTTPYRVWLSMETHYRLDSHLTEEQMRLPGGAGFSAGGAAATAESVAALKDILQKEGLL